jgi:carnitine 3-dehydrogenase
VTAVAVVGAGLQGASWAALFAAHGLEVRLYDRDGAAARAAQGRAQEMARFLVDQGLAVAAVAEAGLARMRALADPTETFAAVSHVQECVTEDLATKRAVFRLASEHVPADALLATSSSGLSISQIQQDVLGPERCLAAHPYNPPHLVPLVELAPGALTAPEAIDRARAFYRSVGMAPVVVHRDVPGYIGNRLSAALWREAVELVRSGVASVEEVDSAVRNGPGLRWAVMGPHLLYHLGGGAGGIRGHLDHLVGVKEGMLRDLATWTTFPDDTADVLEAGLAEETAGRSMADLVRERDEILAGILRLRSTIRDSAIRDSSGPGASGPGPEESQ